MKALLCKKLGDPASASVRNESEPSSSPIEVIRNYPIPQLNSPIAVRVKVKATSLNYANYLQILGKYQEKPPLPFILGSDYAGTVDAVGSTVIKFKVGDYVCSFAALGFFASFIVLLVLGAIGGVGFSTVQIGKVCGAVVIAAA
ncbi:hypothetical protein Goshw_011550, partial [Gossypium schwendimanii]|nr:hypothetical protein [Gossypium schwendimanii]